MREQTAQQLPLKRRASATPQANPHYAGFHAGPHLENQPYQSTQLTRAQAYEEDEDDVPDSYYRTRLPNSTRRYHMTGEEEIVQGNRRIVIHREPPPGRRRFHPVFFLGLGMFVMIGGWWLLTNIGTWWMSQLNNWNYGMPRTYQVDAVVGHNDSHVHPSHFLALNLDGKVEIIEIPGGDPTHERVYLGPTLYSDNASLIPVTVSFKDVNGDGKPDMLLHIQGQTIIYLNSGTQFQSPR